MNATIIIPAYNPDEKLRQIVDQVWDLGNQIILVDDGSDSSCMELFHELSEKAIVIHHKQNQGKGAAIKTALTYIKENIWDSGAIGVMDADGQHLPEDMEKLVMHVKENEDTLVLGVRRIGKEMPFRSRFGNSVTRGIFRLLSGVRVSDTQTGLRAFPGKMLDGLLTVPGTRYEYETNVLFYCAKNKIPIVELPIRTIYQDKQNSGSHFRIIRDSLRIYKDMLRFSLASFSSFLLDYVLFCLFTLLFPVSAAGILCANVFARLLSGVYNYILNCRFVFHSGAKAQTALQYLGLAIAILLLNSVILQFYHEWLHIPVYAAKIATELSLFVISFLVQKKLIFRLKGQEKGKLHLPA